MPSKERLSLKETISAQRGKFHIELERGGRGISLLASGIICISDFSKEKIELKSHSGRIMIEGKRLSATVYEGGNIEISGKIELLGFRYGKN